MSNYYKEQRKAYEELNTLVNSADFNEDLAIFKLTLKYEVSELSLRKRIKLIKKVINEVKE